MHHFRYFDGTLTAENVRLPAIADAVGTPFYCYSTATLVRHYRVLEEAFRGLNPLICYAIKANSNQAVIKTLADLGAGMDVVSEGEIRRAFAAGVAPGRIIFAGVGKSEGEMGFALVSGVTRFNVESEPELEALSRVASGLGVTAEIALRVNPDVDPKTHKKIATGTAETKFGVPYSEARRLNAKAARLPGLAVRGVHMHIGSQITDLEPFRRAFALMRELILALRADGHTINHADLGGGLGVPYETLNELPPQPADYAAVAAEALGDLEVRLLLEPGRMIVANAGVLVSRVILVKRGQERSFVVVDAAMNDLIRPTLYEAHHEIWPVAEAPPGASLEPFDVVGPVCETGDYLAQARRLPPAEAGDLLAIMTAGAYGAVQAGTYNSRLLVPEVLVDGDQFALVRPRQTYDQLIGLDRLPPWLEAGAVTGTGRLKPSTAA